MNYTIISNFGSNSNYPINNPLTYCMTNNMDSQFMHGGNSDTIGKHSKHCQLFMSEYCSKKWDEFCEIASQDTTRNLPDQIESCNGAGLVACRGLNSGEVLIHNTAARKYLIKMHNGRKKYEPFDPNVATSPMISYWVSDNCFYSNTGIPEYAVNPEIIDNDIVMDKILAKPIIAFNILVNIYNTMKRYGTLHKLKNTKLGNYFQNTPYFKNKGGIY